MLKQLGLVFVFALMFVASATAVPSCAFRSRDDIFPIPMLNGSDGILRITENDASGVADDKAWINVTFHMPADTTNEYYIMSAVTPNEYDSATDLDVDPSGSTAIGGGARNHAFLDKNKEDKLADGDVIFSSHQLMINDGVCTELDCRVKYHLLYELGAGPSDLCQLSRTGKSSVYVRAHYSIKLELHYRRVEGTVDFSHWNSLMVSTDVLLTQEDVDRTMEFSAENVQSIAQFSLGSNFMLDGDSQGACLSSSAASQNSTGAVGDSGATHTGDDNSYTRCTVRGYGYIHQLGANDETFTPGFDDQDPDSANSDLLYRDTTTAGDAGGVQMWIAQYSQMGGSPAEAERLDADEPTNFNATGTTGEARLVTTDYRLDVCEVYGATLTQVDESGARNKTVISTVTDDFDIYHFGAATVDDHTNGYIDGTGSHSLETDITTIDSDVVLANINAFVACKYQIDPPTSCSGGSDSISCTYTPLFYFAAWFDESIPANTAGDVDHVHYTNNANREEIVVDEHDGADSTTTNDGQAGQPYDNDLPSRRLRGTPSLLKAAANKVASPHKAKRVHFMRISMKHGK